MNSNSNNNNSKGETIREADVTDAAVEMVTDNDNNIITGNNDTNNIGPPKGINTAKGGILVEGRQQIDNTS